MPSGPQLQTLNNQIYIYVGNPGLCGPPLLKSCSINGEKQSERLPWDGIGFVVGLWTIHFFSSSNAIQYYSGSASGREPMADRRPGRLTDL
uniref:Uncharacterized protein n=1 Tax=Oryza meridionalis TaxID=40149 RepID=A0A0E0C4B0_9ORYZ